MADRPRKSLSQQRAERTGASPNQSKASGWLTGGRKKAVDASSRLKKFSSSGLKSARKAVRKGRTKAYLHDFFKNAPKGRLRRFLWWLHPERQIKFWFSKDGALLAAKTTAFGFACLILFAGLVYAYYSKDLKDPTKIGYLNQATKFYDRTGKHLLYSIYGDENRTVVEFDQISDHAKHATVAIEDKNFYHHIGLSPTGILRATVNNLRGKSTQGGSTITQQYVKNALLTNERSFERKIKEAILALEMERLYEKDEILGFYLNEIPYGGTAYGIEAAAHSFFNKPASKLTVDESAMLAALPQAPTYYSPYGEHTDELRGRAHYIIDLMAEQGYVTKEEAEAAKATDTFAKLNKNFKAYRNIKAPYLVLEAQRRLEEQYGAQVVATSGWQIITTVDLDLQKKAEKAVADNIGAIIRDGGDTAAVVATDPNTGQVLAAVGGRDFNDPEFGRYNAAFTALRQPGSSIKPYTYATLMKGNYGAGTVLYDLSTDFGGGYEPSNADNRTKGAMPIRAALAESRNITAVKALYMAGLENTFQTWRDVGMVSSDLDPARHGLAFGLGTAELKLAEHVNGYETFANGGLHRDQALWLKITNPQGQVVDEWRDDGGKQVIDPQIAYIIADILSDTNAKRPLLGSLGRYLQIPGNIQLATKTGTTQSRRDAWTMGSSTCLTAGVWVGHHANKPMARYSILMAGPLFQDFMTAAHHGKKCKNFDRPDGIKKATLDRYTGRKPDEATGGNRVTDIFPSWYKPADASGTERFTIDIVSGKLATDCTPDGARREVAVGGIDAEIPPADPAYPRWSRPVRAYAARLGREAGVSAKPTEKDDVHHCKPPVFEEFKAEPEGVGTYKFTAKIKQGEFPGKQMDFKVNGQIISGGVVSGSGNCGMDCYTVTASVSSGKATATFTDEGYYQITSNEQDVLGASTGPFTITSPGEDQNVDGMTTTISWTGGNGPYTVYVNGPAPGGFAPGCSSTANSCQINTAAPGEYRVYVQDSNGNTTSTRKFYQ
jgi:membrane peptidoglycan carboxypeptidase